MKSAIKQHSTYEIIDKISVRLVETHDKYWARLSNLDLDFINVEESEVREHDRLLMGGVWAEIRLRYDDSYVFKGQNRPFFVESIRPIQLSTATSSASSRGGSDSLATSGSTCSCGPWATSPTTRTTRSAASCTTCSGSFRSSSGTTTRSSSARVARARASSTSSLARTATSSPAARRPRRRCSLTLEPASGVSSRCGTLSHSMRPLASSFTDKNGINIMKGYMEDGVFSRGSDVITAEGSIVFVGNIDGDIETIIRTSNLFYPMPKEMDTAFYDRIHAYIPGWEFQKTSDAAYTNHFGLVTDYLAEVFREVRKRSYGDLAERYFRFGQHLGGRDQKAVRKTVSGLIKLLHPDGEVSQDRARGVPCLRDGDAATRQGATQEDGRPRVLGHDVSRTST